MRIQSAIIFGIAFLIVAVVGGYATFISVSIPPPALWRLAVLWAVSIMLAVSIGLAAYQVIRAYEGRPRSS